MSICRSVRGCQGASFSAVIQSSLNETCLTIHQCPTMGWNSGSQFSACICSKHEPQPTPRVISGWPPMSGRPSHFSLAV